jgi:thioredoxin-like negative regulator of GroEL
MEENEFHHPPSNAPLKVVVFLICAAAGYWGVRHLRSGSDAVPWRTDLTMAKAEASREGKPLVVYFTADWCPPCQEMKRSTWSSPKVAAAMQDYIPVKIDVDDQPDVARQFRIKSIPQVHMLLSNGETGPAISGYVDDDQMASWLR